MDILDANPARTAIVAYLAEHREDGVRRKDICDALGLSQTVVWKHISYLIEHHAVVPDVPGDINGRTVRYRLIPEVVLAQLDAFRATLTRPDDRPRDSLA